VTQRFGWSLAVCALVGAAAALWAQHWRRSSSPEAALQALTVATSGGLIQDAGRATLWGPASSRLGLTVREQSFENGYDLVRLQSAAGRVSIDAIELPSFLAARGFHDGLLSALDYSVIDASAFPARSAPQYCIGMLSSSWVLGWNREHFPGVAPRTWADFWDVKRFPGRRGAHLGAEAQLEIALLADGVPRQRVYDVLSSERGMQRALLKWKALKPSIAIWWSTGSQLAQLMRDGELDLAIGWNARFDQAIADGAPVAFTYQDGVLARDCWAVPTAAPHRLLAMNLINLMTRAEAQARFATLVNYGPLNSRAFATGLIPQQVALHLPTYPENLSVQLSESDEWWSLNSQRAERAFDEIQAL
jgi:putative spermidine/putrescine transport system substrate-binding protein